jgi:hypothetical protein
MTYHGLTGRIPPWTKDEDLPPQKLLIKWRSHAGCGSNLSTMYLVLYLQSNVFDETTYIRISLCELSDPPDTLNSPLLTHVNTAKSFKTTTTPGGPVTPLDFVSAQAHVIVESLMAARRLQKGPQWRRDYNGVG